MRSEADIRRMLARCRKAMGFGLSEKPCPREKGGRKGCCAECTFPSAIEWVLGGDRKGTENAQHRLIEAVKAAIP